MHTHTHTHTHTLSPSLSLSFPAPPLSHHRYMHTLFPPHTIAAIPARVCARACARAPCVCVCVCAHTHTFLRTLSHTHSITHARTHAHTHARTYNGQPQVHHGRKKHTHTQSTHTHTTSVIHLLTLTHYTMAARCTHTQTHNQSFSYTHSPRQDSHRHPWRTRASCKEGHKSDQLCFRARSRARRSLAPAVQEPPCPSCTFRCQFSSV
jgi:hypothetical protein